MKCVRRIECLLSYLYMIVISYLRYEFCDFLATIMILFMQNVRTIIYDFKKDLVDEIQHLLLVPLSKLNVAPTRSVDC